MNGERKLALFTDFENIARGVKEAQYKRFEIKLVLERLVEKRPFHEAAIELIDVPQTRYSA